MPNELNYKLPNIRKLFVPDKGYVLFDCDLSGADAQVVAWDAEDEDLKAAFRNGTKIHIKNLEDMYKRPFEEERDKKPAPGHRYSAYDELKRSIHATNYGSSARTLAITLGWKVNQAKEFQHRWFQLHPAIGRWHKRVERDLQATRSVSNQFGYRIQYFDRIESLFTKALAWIPQSTVGIVCSKGGVALHKEVPYVEPLLQVHDSIVFQVPFAHITPSSLEEIRRNLHVPVPYSDELIIPWELSASIESWGDCKKCEWGNGLREVLS